MAVYKHRGSWMYDFTKNDMRYREGGYRTKSQAIEEEAKARANAKRISTDFIRLCNSRLQDLELRRTKGHFERNKRLVKILIKRWASLRVVTTEDVTDYLNEVANVSKHTANIDLRLIRALYNHGIKNKWFDANPCQGIQPFGVEKKRKYVPPIEDIQKVLAAADEEERKYLLTILYTMARVREINRLKWEDVHENYLILRTRKAKNSDVIERTVPFTPTLQAIFKGLEHKGEYVFINPRSRTRYDNRIKLIRSLCEKAEVKTFTFHNLRHWGASKLAKERVPIPDIQALLGHTRPTTTDNYLQSICPDLGQAIRKLEE